MIDNGKVEIKREVKDGCAIESFVYDHQRAIEGYKPVDVYCQVNVDIPNTYLKSILDIFNSDTFGFTDGKIHRNDDKFDLEKTNGIIVTYVYCTNNNKYVGKMLIQDGKIINVFRNELNSIIIKVKKGE